MHTIFCKINTKFSTQFVPKFMQIEWENKHHIFKQQNNLVVAQNNNPWVSLNSLSMFSPWSLLFKIDPSVSLLYAWLLTWCIAINLSSAALCNAVEYNAIYGNKLYRIRVKWSGGKYSSVQCNVAYFENAHVLTAAIATHKWSGKTKYCTQK